MFPPNPAYEGSPASSGMAMRTVRAVSWGCHPTRSALPSDSSKGASPPCSQVFALCDAARCSCLALVMCSDLSLAGDVHEVMAITSQTGPLREGSFHETLVIS